MFDSLGLAAMSKGKPREAGKTGLFRMRLSAILLGLAAVVFVFLELPPVLTGSVSGGDVTLRIALTILFVPVMLLGAAAAFRWRPPSVTDETIALEASIKRRDGARTRSVPTSDVSDVEPKLVEGAEGIGVTLKDGTKFFLSQASLGRGSLQVMEQLCSRFGKSYLDSLNEILLDGTKFQFNVLQVGRVNHEGFLLREEVKTYDKGPVRSLTSQEVRKVERVVTRYSGWAYLVTLRDGTRFLIRQTDIRHFDLTQFSWWHPVEKTASAVEMSSTLETSSS